MKTLLCYCYITALLLLLALLPDCPFSKNSSTDSEAAMTEHHSNLHATTPETAVCLRYFLKQHIILNWNDAGKSQFVYTCLAGCLDQEAREAAGSYCWPYSSTRMQQDSQHAVCFCGGTLPHLLQTHCQPQQKVALDLSCIVHLLQMCNALPALLRCQHTSRLGTTEVLVCSLGLMSDHCLCMGTHFYDTPHVEITIFHVAAALHAHLSHIRCRTGHCCSCGAEMHCCCCVCR